MKMAGIKSNHCQSTRSQRRFSRFYEFTQFGLRPAFRRPRNVIPNCFIAGKKKFPREVKSLEQGAEKSRAETTQVFTIRNM